MPDGIPKHHKPLLLQPLLSLHLQSSITHLVLLSTACPTSLASDQTEGGGRPGVQRTPRFGAREQRFDLTKIQLSSKLSPKDPKEFAKKIREWRGAAPGKGRPTHHNTKGNSTETSRLFAHTERSVAGALRLKFFFFLSVPCGGSFTHVVRVHVEPHALRVSVDCLTEYLNTISF